MLHSNCAALRLEEDKVVGCYRISSVAVFFSQRTGTFLLSRAWSGMSTRQYKNFKGLKKENLRDNMTTLELVLNMLAEATTTEISKQKSPGTFSENLAVAREGGEAAGIARKAVEERTGVPVITAKNAAQLNQVVTDLLEGATTSPEKQDKRH